jgi:23S rRNA (cytosine1962-C5)-methyltransferase
MSENPRIYSKSWDDYELLDAGGGKKLERWGKIITIRPEMQAYFHSGKPFPEWRELAHWEFVEDAKGQTGKWKNLKKVYFGLMKLVLKKMMMVVFMLRYPEKN